MATVLKASPWSKPITPDAYERVLAGGAIVMLGFVLVAIARGHADWPKVPLFIWLHLATIITALVLTPVLLLQPRGSRRHRRLGRVWVIAMTLTALLSFNLRDNGGFSIIHILSAYVVVMAPMIWWRARTHRIEAHRGAVRGMVTGALLIAGFFTFPFHRLLGHWLFG